METFQRYLYSTIITFLAAFGLAVLPILGDIAYTKAALLALAVAGVRAGIKAVAEFLTPILVVLISR